MPSILGSHMDTFPNLWQSKHKNRMCTATLLTSPLFRNYQLFPWRHWTVLRIRYLLRRSTDRSIALSHSGERGRTCIPLFFEWRLRIVLNRVASKRPMYWFPFFDRNGKRTVYYSTVQYFVFTDHQSFNESMWLPKQIAVALRWRQARCVFVSMSS